MPLRRALRGCLALLELGWLTTLMLVPCYFNIYDVRAFEPDKAYLTRDCAALLGVLALLALTLRLAAGARRDVATTRPACTPRTLWRHVVSLARRYPTLAPMLALALVTGLATATSILPSASWYGSYARAEGALTITAYLVVGIVILAFLRRPAPLERLSTAIALAGVAPAGYGWVQHLGRDPLPWQQADLAARVPGTMGNPIFLGALLVITLPLAMLRLILAAWPHGPGPAAPGLTPARLAAVAGWGAVVLLEAGALFFTKSRGPFAGLLAELPVFAVAAASAWQLRWLRRLTLGVTAISLLLLLGLNLLGTAVLGRIQEGSALRLLQWAPSASGSSEVRLDIWAPALSLIPKRPLLGCGPDVLQFCYYPVYPTALRHIEAPNAVPDRTHNMFLDAAVETGLLGLAAFLALLGVTALTLWRLTRRAADPRHRLLAAALLAALAGHLVEGFFGIPIVATQLLTWCIAGMAGAMVAMARPATAPCFGVDRSPRPMIVVADVGMVDCPCFGAIVRPCPPAAAGAVAAIRPQPEAPQPRLSTAPLLVCPEPRAQANAVRRGRR
jgi:O-antigen ligase